MLELPSGFSVLGDMGHTFWFRDCGLSQGIDPILKRLSNLKLFCIDLN